MDGDSVQKYVSNGITHYIMTNEDYIQIVWARNNYQTALQFSDSSIDANRIIDSIYEG